MHARYLLNIPFITERYAMGESISREGYEENAGEYSDIKQAPQ